MTFAQQDPHGVAWYHRLQDRFWLYKGLWHLAYFLGRVFSFGCWHPLKDFYPTTLTDLPPALLTHIAEILSPEETPCRVLGEWATVCKATYKIAQVSLQGNLKISRLVEYVLKGNLDKVKAMLLTEPALIFIKPPQPVTDYSGRRILQSAWEAAWGAEDEDMIKMMMEKILPKIDNGYPKALKQYEEQYPEGEEKEIDYTAFFTPFVKAIDSYDFKNTGTILKKFRDDYYINARKSITHGKHFDIQFLIQAIKHYFETDWYMQNNYGKALFRHHVIIFLHHYLPASYAQALCYELSKQCENKQSSRSLLYPDGNYFYPFANQGNFADTFSWGTTSVVQYCFSLKLEYLEAQSRSKNNELKKLKNRLQEVTFVAREANSLERVSENALGFRVK